jgi:DNA-binding NarL/FixJ family response regulator
VRDLGLRPRERAVARCMLQAWGNQRVARELGLSVETVKGYVYTLLEKTGQDERVALAVWLLRTPWALGQVMETEDIEVVAMVSVGC